jgi:D-tyrosyl-tRNA(Tyr) deacylase
MRALVQRTTGASVTIGGETVGEIGPGLVVLVCAMRGDDEAATARLARKTAALRIFRDEAGRMNRALREAGGAALVVSQFTLAADTSRGYRPGFSGAARPELGRLLYERVVATARRLSSGQVACGEFGADMQVALVNDGPVTIPITLRA